MRLLQEAFKAEFERVLRKTPTNLTDVAVRLGITRQSLYNYLAGSIPRKDHLARIIEMWPDFRVEAGGQVYDKDSLLPIATRSPQPVAQQLDFIDVLKGLTQENLDISVKRVKQDTQIFLTIKIPA